MTKIFPVSRFTVHGNSMFPTLHPDQDILSFNWAYLGRKPKVGDIVVIKVDGREMVKRVQLIHGRMIVVTGDNKEESTDSRHFGAVNINQVIGKVIYTSSHPERSEGYKLYSSAEPQNDIIDCPQCEAPLIGIYGRKDAICQNCGFKMTCCE